MLSNLATLVVNAKGPWWFGAFKSEIHGKAAMQAEQAELDFFNSVMPIDDYSWSVRINYAPNVVNHYRKLDEQNADRAKLNSVVERGWNAPKLYDKVKNINDGLGIAFGTQSELITYSVAQNYKSSSTSWAFSGLRKTQQSWRINNTLGKTGGNFLKGLKVAGVVGNVASVGLKSYEILDKGYATKRDIADLTVNTAAVGAVLFMATNPIGWGIGAFALGYSISTVIYDAYNEEK